MLRFNQNYSHVPAYVWRKEFFAIGRIEQVDLQRGGEDVPHGAWDGYCSVALPRRLKFQPTSKFYTYILGIKDYLKRNINTSPSGSGYWYLSLKDTCQL